MPSESEASAFFNRRRKSRFFGGVYPEPDEGLRMTLIWLCAKSDSPALSWEGTGRGIGVVESSLGGVRRNLPVEHGENIFPISRCGMLVIDIAVRQRIAVLRPRVHMVAIADGAWL
jgi:hypothetical protein